MNASGLYLSYITVAVTHRPVKTTASTQTAMSILRVVRFMRRRRACPAFSSRLVRAFAFSTARQAGQSSWSGFSSGLPQFLQVSIALPRVFLIFSRRSAAGVYSRA